MESREEVYKAEAEARGKKIKRCMEVLAYCRSMINTIKINPAVRKEMLYIIDEVLENE